ncbi:MAG: acyl-CoA thioesterase [Nevskiales bacterium]
MNAILTDLVRLLALEQLEVNLYRGESRDLGGRSVFGGQVLGQALMAAYGTVDWQAAHSLHAYFLRPGDMEAPIVYEVERLRDGRHFLARQVHAIQHGQPIFSMMASFQKLEPGLDHQSPMPVVPLPEALASQHELRQQWLHLCPEKLRRGFMRELAIEFKPVWPSNPFQPEPRPPQQHIWFRAAGSLPSDQTLHRCVLAYASDFNLLSTAMLAHGVTYLQPEMVVASLDHALWFHRDVQVDDWLLYSMDSPSSSGARGLSRGMIYNRAGKLVASVLQESLMRKTTLVRDSEH